MTGNFNEDNGFQSYLNNDEIDEILPTMRKHRVSSLSLSDLNQWQNGILILNSSVSLKSKDISSSNLTKVDSLVMISRNPSLIKRKKKKIIDHERVASYAFCFDIDGVILRGKDVIPEAIEAMKLIKGKNIYNITVPCIFVTNGGGKLEADRAENLSEKLQTVITPEQIIQGHTPMKDLVGLYDTVLVVGGVGNMCRDVAESYGFKNVYTPLDILKWNPAVSPYHELTDEEKKCAKDADFSKISFDAILVFADSRNWASDQQIILELLLSENGVMGTEAKDFNNSKVTIYFSHSDFIWATNYNLSRYGMGALQVSIAALYREHTSKELKVNRFGKPQKKTFHFTNKILSSWRLDVLDEHLRKVSKITENNQNISPKDEILIQEKDLNYKYDNDCFDSDDDMASKKSQDLFYNEKKITLELPPASTVYFVGDTPESDIRFANSHDDSWHSILVKTGVYKEGTVPKYKPKYLADNILEAVKYAIKREHQKELQEWNEVAVQEEDKSAKLKFADLMTTPNEKKEFRNKLITKSIKDHDIVEVPNVLNKLIEKVKDVKINKN